MQTPAVLVRGVLAAPKPWWVQGLLVACKTDHLNAAVAAGAGQLSTGDAEHDQ
jgi:hypothetical protein